MCIYLFHPNVGILTKPFLFFISSVLMFSVGFTKTHPSHAQNSQCIRFAYDFRGNGSSSSKRKARFTFHAIRGKCFPHYIVSSFFLHCPFHRVFFFFFSPYSLLRDRSFLFFRARVYVSFLGSSFFSLFVDGVWGF